MFQELVTSFLNIVSKKIIRLIFLVWKRIVKYVIIFCVSTKHFCNINKGNTISGKYIICRS